MLESFYSIIVQLVRWCFEPSHPQRITSGLNTNFTLSPSHIHFTSHHTTSNVFLAYLYSVGTQHGNLYPAGWPILFCEPIQEAVWATANTWKIRRGFGKNAGDWTGRVEISKGEMPGSKRSMYGYILTYSRLYIVEPLMRNHPSFMNSFFLLLLLFFFFCG